MNDREPNDQVAQGQVSKTTVVEALVSGSITDNHNEPNNLPMVVMNKDNDDSYQKAVDQTIKDLDKFQKDSEQYSNIKNLSEFLEKFVSVTTMPGEVKNLSRLINALRDNHGQLIEGLNSVRNIKKDRGNKDKDRDIFLQEKVFLKLVDRAINENSRFVEVLEQVVSRNERSIEETSQLEISTIEDQQERGKTEDMVVKNMPVQIAKTEEYKSMINLFTQDKARLETIATIIGAHVDIQNPLIQDEYHRRAQVIYDLFNKSMFYGRSFDDFWLFASQKSKFKENATSREILEVQSFNLEDLSQYPDYRLISLYLTFINAWVKDETGLFVEDRRRKIEETIKLSKDLLMAIDPSLLTEQMKETVNLLDIVINKDRDFESKKKFIRKKSEIELERTTGIKIEVPPLPDYVTPRMLEKMEDKGVELMFDPGLDFGSFEELQRIGVEEYVSKLKQRYPELCIDLSYWSEVAKGSVDFPKLPGRWIAIETMRTFLDGEEVEKKKIDNYYPFVPYGQRDLSWNTVKELIKRDESKILDYFGLEIGEVRIPNALEFFLFDYLGDKGVETFIDNDRDDGVWDRYCVEWTNDSFEPNHFSIMHGRSCGQRYFDGWGANTYFGASVGLRAQRYDIEPRFRYAIVLPDSQPAHSKNIGLEGRFRRGWRRFDDRNKLMRPYDSGLLKNLGKGSKV